MALSRSEQLTQQFYDFELRGRGWFVAPFPVELEPHFHPFFRYYLPSAYIDDSRRDTLLSSIANIFKPPTPLPEIESYVTPPFDLLPFANSETLAGLAIAFGKQAKPSIDLMEQCLTMCSTIHTPISFEIVADRDTITIQLIFREQYKIFIYGQLFAYFPEAIIVPLDDIDNLIDETLPTYTADFGLTEECMRPIATARTEPLTGFYGLLEQLRNDERVVMQVLFNGTANQWAGSFERVVSDGYRGSFFVEAPEMPSLAKEKCSTPLFAVTVRALTQSHDHQSTKTLLQHVCFAITQASTSPYNALGVVAGDDYTFEQRIEDIEERRSHRMGMLLNVRELATLAHFPASTVTPKLQRYARTTKAAPIALHNQPYSIGMNEHHGVSMAVGIDDEQRTRHTHIIGSSGTGKTTLLKNLISLDMAQGKGLCCIDCHGDLIDELLRLVPDHRVNDVVLIDPSDSQHPVSLNILSAHSDLERELLASDLVALFRRFSTSWGDQMNSVFANAISAFLYNTTAGTLGDLRKFLIEPPFRASILSTCTDPEITYYWQKEYPLLKSSSIGSIITRLDSFLRPKAIRNMVTQKQGLNFQELMDNQKIVLVKLSQGLIGEENSHLLGAFIVSKLQQTAMARQAQAVQERVAFHCYIDEFHHFITPSMVTILSGTRKYALTLTLAHQNMQQVASIDQNLASGLLSNAGTRICFKVTEDAKKMQEGFSSFTADDLQNLAIGEAIVRVNIAARDFNIRVVPCETQATSYVQQIIEQSRNLYSAKITAPIIMPPVYMPEPTPKREVYTPPPAAEPVPIPEKEQREHVYLQRVIKKLGQERGYIAHTEVATPDGKGLIDVVLEKDGKATAFEVSVTTTAEWELHNIKKCITAGYTDIVVCVTNQTKLSQLQKLVAELQQVRIITPEQIPGLFDISTTSTENGTTYKGYRVKVRYDNADNGTKNDIIQRILKSRG